MKRITLIAFLITLAVLPKAQTIENTFDLSFQSATKGYRWPWLTKSFGFEFSMNKQDTNRCLVIEPTSKLKRLLSQPISGMKQMQNRAEFILARTVVLPPAEKEAIYSADLICQNNIDSLSLIVLALDNQERVLVADSIFIKPTGNFANNKISLKPCRPRALRIIIRYSENTAIASQGNEKISTNKSSDIKLQGNGKAFRLREVAISVNSSSVNKVLINNIARKQKTLLSNTAIVPLSFSKSSNLSKIYDWKGKKIIGLGEFAHGSQEVKDARIQFVKHLAHSNHCRAIFFEASLDMVLRWDLYVQGILPDSFNDELISDLKVFFDNYQTAFELLGYLRKYNATATKKIHVFGVDNLDDNAFIIDYFRKLGDNGYYSDLFAKREFKKLKEELLKKSDWIELLGKENFDYLLFAIDEQERKYKITPDDYYNQRDLNMYKHVEKIAELYPGPSDQFVIFAHSMHINKVSLFYEYRDKPSLGAYLAGRYKDQYFAVAFQAGEGFYSQDSTSIQGNTMTAELPIAPVYSFENAALKTGISYFYYPTTKIPEDMCALRVAPRESRCFDNFRFCYLPKRFDAVVFINKSHKLDSIERFPAYYFSTYKREFTKKTIKWLNENQKSVKDATGVSK